MKKILPALVAVLLFLTGVFPGISASSGEHPWHGNPSDGATASPAAPNRTIFQNPPNEYRVKPIVPSQSCTAAEFGKFKSQGFGGLVVNPWAMNTSLWQTAKSDNWEMWVNDYYMYPSGNANPLGGVHETLWNPGFESQKLGLWPDGWQWSYIDWPIVDNTGADSHSGTGAVCCDDSNAYMWRIGIIPGEKYNLSLWARGASGTEYGRICIFWQSFDKILYPDIAVYKTTNEYTQHFIEGTAPPNANVAMLMVFAHERNKYVWYDDVVFRRVAAYTNLLQNPGFETDANLDNHPDGWYNNSSPIYDTSGANSRSGTDAVCCNSTCFYLQPVPCAPGTYLFTAWARGTAPGLTGHMAILWCDSLNQIVGVDIMPFSVGTGWTCIEMAREKPASAVGGYAVLASPSDTQWVWYDDIFFSLLPKPNNGVSRGPVLDGHPELEAQGLYYNGTTVDGPKQVTVKLPQGRPYYACAVRNVSGSLNLSSAVDLTASVLNNSLTWDAPTGKWTICTFSVDILYNGTECDPSISNMHQVNLLNRYATSLYIDAMYEGQVNQSAKGFIGNTVKASFSDESSSMAMYFIAQPFPVSAWVDDDVHGIHFSAEFSSRWGYDVKAMLPALYHDAGAGTTKYRCDFYETVGELVGGSFFSQIGSWCGVRGMNLSGHLLTEDSLIHHTGFYGDVFRSYKGFGWPGVDILIKQAGEWEGDLMTCKLASSAAHLYGKGHVMTEISYPVSSYSLKNVTPVNNWQLAQGIDKFTSFTYSTGTNMDDASLIKENENVGRSSYLTTFGDYRGDVLLYYPISTVQSQYIPKKEVLWETGIFGGYKYDQGFRDCVRYLLGHQLDFDIVDDVSLNAMSVGGKTIDLGNLHYRVLILPPLSVVNYSSLLKAKAFFDAGGTVVATDELPSESRELGGDARVAVMVDTIFDRNTGGNPYTVRTSPGGGKAFFLAGGIEVLDMIAGNGYDPDLMLDTANPGIYCMHRGTHDTDIFYLVNNNDTAASHTVFFRAEGDIELWNPETGLIQAVSGAFNGTYTAVSLSIPGYSSVFVVFNHPVKVPESVLFLVIGGAGILWFAAVFSRRITQRNL